VVDAIALSGRALLVLERGFVAGQGNTVRLFTVSLKGAADVSGVASLADPGPRPVAKRLVVDLGSCPPLGATNSGTQANPLLDNFEAIALGPRLRGKRTLLVLSDDNFNPTQVTRIVALRLP